MNDWQAFEAEMGRIISAETEKPFTPETIAQARDFLAAVRDRCPIPEVGKGYWSTIIFDWACFKSRFSVIGLSSTAFLIDAPRSGMCPTAWASRFRPSS